MNRDVQAPRGDAGFTLLELLVTLAVLSGISTLILGAIVTVRQTAQRLLEGETASASVGAAQSILRSRIEGLRPVPRSNVATPVVDLEGDGQRLSFYAPPIERDAPGSLQAFRLLRMATGDVVLFSASALTEDVDLRSPTIVGWTSTRLIDGVTDLSISYYGPAPGAAGPAWQRFWGNRAQPPQLIRIGLKFGDGDRRQWPELIIRPRVTVNLACRIDRVTARCGEGAGS